MGLDHSAKPGLLLELLLLETREFMLLQILDDFIVSSRITLTYLYNTKVLE